MKTWEQLSVGNGVLALAYLNDEREVIVGSISEVNDNNIIVFWDCVGLEYSYTKSESLDRLHFYENEAEKLALRLKLL